MAGDTDQKHFVELRKQNAHRSHLGAGLEIVVSRFDLHALLATSGEVPNLHGSFGIHGNAQHFRVSIGCCVDLVHLFEDGIGSWELFFGLLLATFIG